MSYRVRVVAWMNEDGSVASEHSGGEPDDIVAALVAGFVSLTAGCVHQHDGPLEDVMTYVEKRFVEEYRHAIRSGALGRYWGPKEASG